MLIQRYCLSVSPAPSAPRSEVAGVGWPGGGMLVYGRFPGTNPGHNPYFFFQDCLDLREICTPLCYVRLGCGQWRVEVVGYSCNVSRKTEVCLRV